MTYTSEAERTYLTDEDGNQVAEVTYPLTSRGYHNINHTLVDESLEGKGVGGELIRRAANTIREAGHEAVATCPFAIAWFEKHPEEADILL